MTGVTSSFVFGMSAWPAVVPVVGDWDGDGIDGIGYCCRSTPIAQRDSGTSATPPSAGDPDGGSFVFRPATATYPAVGDWDASGTDTFGSKAGTSRQLANTNVNPAASMSFDFGAANDMPVVWAM